MPGRTLIIGSGEILKFCVVGSDLRVAPDIHGIIMARMTGDKRFRERDTQRVALDELLASGVIVDMGGISRGGDRTILVSGNSSGMNYPQARQFEVARPLTMVLFETQYDGEKFFKGGL